MKNFLKKVVMVLCVINLMPVTAFGENLGNNTDVQNTGVEIEKVDDSEMSDDELAELERKFDDYINWEKEMKKQGYRVHEMSVPDFILEEEENETMVLASNDRDEVEPNNTISSADRTYINDFMYGTISDKNDVDYFKIKFSEAGQGYFRLVVPEDVDYDLFVLGQTGTEIRSSCKGRGETDRVYAYVTPGIYYYIRVEGAGDNDYDEINQYFVRVKLYEDETEYAVCIGAEYGDGLNTADDEINAYNVFDGIGYASEFCIVPTYEYLDGTNPDDSDRLGSSIVFLDGHGEYNHIKFESPNLSNTSNKTYTTGVSTKQESFERDGNTYVSIRNKDVSNSRLMVFSACYTAKEVSGEKNLTQYAVIRGAETAIGWREKIAEEASAVWNERFLDKLSDGYTVKDAALYADKKFQRDSAITHWSIEGNKANVINLSGPYKAKSAKKLSRLSDINCTQSNIFVDMNSRDLTELENIIKSEYEYFNPDDYETMIVPVNTNDKNTYRVYYERCINGFDTNTGFYAVIENNELYYLTERTTDYDLDLLATKTVNLTDDVIEEAKQIAANQIEDRYYITDQTVDKMIIDGMYSLVVNTTYAIDYGTEDQAFSCKSYTYKL